jgi:hypothetical protein
VESWVLQAGRKKIASIAAANKIRRQKENLNISYLQKYFSSEPYGNGSRNNSHRKPCKNLDTAAGK